MFEDAETHERFMGRWSRLAAGPFVDFTGLPEGGRTTGSLAFLPSRAGVVGMRRRSGEPMRSFLIVAGVAAALATALPSGRAAAPREERVPAGKASLYAREI